MDEKTIWYDLGKAPKCPQNEVIDVGDIDGAKIIKPVPINNNYNRLTNKPSINGVVLEGDKTTEDLDLNTDANYTHQQTDASAEWVIVHNLNKYPAVSIIDSAGEEVEGNVHYDSTNQVTITFVGAFKGTATLN